MVRRYPQHLEVGRLAHDRWLVMVSWEVGDILVVWGTAVEFQGYDDDSGWPIVQWLDGTVSPIDPELLTEASLWHRSQSIQICRRSCSSTGRLVLARQSFTGVLLAISMLVLLQLASTYRLEWSRVCVPISIGTRPAAGLVMLRVLRRAWRKRVRLESRFDRKRG